jgi:DNA-binding MarR family transcriptional regulator
MSDALADLPPSAALVYRSLRDDGPATLEEVCERDYLAERTAKRALRRLREADLVEATTPLDDARRTVYRLDRGQNGTGHD